MLMMSSNTATSVTLFLARTETLKIPKLLKVGQIKAWSEEKEKFCQIVRGKYQPGFLEWQELGLCNLEIALKWENLELRVRNEKISNKKICHWESDVKTDFCEQKHKIDFLLDNIDMIFCKIFVKLGILGENYCHLMGTFNLCYCFSLTNMCGESSECWRARWDSGNTSRQAATLHSRPRPRSSGKNKWNSQK